ncbi:MAG: SAM-dependent chlorinase/fluorinase [Bacteroidales bacterium]|nr:SAM-dependent chlorinase/fluorinase [Bacteroidales bacterium]
MSNNQIITLLSDWGLQDYYVAMCKGKILSIIPDINIVDISHLVKPFDIAQAAFIFRKCYADFPNGTIHIIGVAAKASFEQSHLIVKNHNQYFIGCNNGFFSLIFDEQPDEIWEINTSGQEGSLLFPSRDLYAPISAAIAKGLPIEKLSHKVDQYLQKSLFEPSIRDNIIRGKVVYIDHYENVYTNISRTVFRKIAHESQSFQINLNGNTYPISGISESFDQIKSTEIGLIFTFEEHLTIVINQGNAAGLFGLKNGDDITLLF